MLSVLSVALLHSVGCGGSEPREDPAGSLESAPRLGLVEVYRLGGVDAPEHEAFSREPALAGRSDGRLFALDRATDRVWEYSPEGVFERAIGGQGEGPGEFTIAGDLGLVGDTLWIRNVSPPFVSFFGRDGTFLRRHTVDEVVVGRTGIPDGPAAMLAGGYHLSVPQVPWGEEPGPQEVAVTLVSPDGAGDTIGFAVDPPAAYAPGVGSLGRWDPGTVPPIWSVTPGGRSVVLVDWETPGQVVIREVVPGADPREDTLRLPVVPLATRAVDSIVAAAGDSARARIERAREQLSPEVAPSVPRDLEARIRTALDLGTELPPLRSVLVGTEGSLWLERPVAPNRWEWAVFDADRRPVGRVELPKGHTLRVATPTAIWTTHTDSFDVPYVTKFDLVQRR